MNRQSAPDFTEISEISRKTTGEYIFENTLANTASGKVLSVFSHCRINSKNQKRTNHRISKIQKFDAGRPNEKDLCGLATDDSGTLSNSDNIPIDKL